MDGTKNELLTNPNRKDYDHEKLAKLSMALTAVAINDSAIETPDAVVQYMVDNNCRVDMTRLGLNEASVIRNSGGMTNAGYDEKNHFRRARRMANRQVDNLVNSLTRPLTDLFLRTSIKDKEKGLSVLAQGVNAGVNLYASVFSIYKDTNAGAEVKQVVKDFVAGYRTLSEMKTHSRGEMWVMRFAKPV